jgi:hypothetical protein
MSAGWLVPVHMLTLEKAKSCENWMSGSFAGNEARCAKCCVFNGNVGLMDAFLKIHHGLWKLMILQGLGSTMLCKLLR